MDSRSFETQLKFPIQQNDYAKIQSLEYTEQTISGLGDFGCIMAYISTPVFVNGVGTGRWAVVGTYHITNSGEELKEIGKTFDKLTTDYLLIDSKCVSTQYVYNNQKYIFRTKSMIGIGFDLLTTAENGALTRKLDSKKKNEIEQIIIEGPVDRIKTLANKLGSQ